ncbi:MAG: ribose 5-phosphate isomerase B [Dehalococcoidia bacterium]|nr:ribose 5-phosphate isomerase B [Dehalococcoidia bacterium]
MRVAVASDHAGFPLKPRVLHEIDGAGLEPIELGVFTTEPSDYPDAAAELATAILEGRADRGILICGSGVGASVAASKFPGIRAALCHDTYSARQGVEHDDMNVLCLGARIVGEELAAEIVRAFLPARFHEDERFVRRLNKVIAIEQRYAPRQRQETTT